MRIASLGLVAGLGIALAVVACVSFDLDSRRFRCDGDPSICGEGWRCGADGYCAPATADAGAPDAPILGEVCNNGEDDDGDDDVDCADAECPGDTTCGTGCLCDDAGPKEVTCGDREDNDRDDLIDCNDPECPSCMGNMMCCPDGACAPSC